ncbi:MAG: CusA/CzcA family heavy metal efflux RND transporter [Pseudomonadota bacterium]
MIDRLVGFALSKRLVVALIAVLIAIFGYYSWTQLAIEAYPDIADTTSQVIAQSPGLAAEEMEQEVTVPLERELNGTPGIAMMRSRTAFGLTLITVVFKDGTDDYFARDRLQERMANAALPGGVEAGLDELTSPIGEMYRYTLESDTKTLRELSEIQRWTVIPALRSVAGVAGVNNFGGVTTQYQLEIDPAALSRYNLTLKTVTDAIIANNGNSGGSVLNRGELGYVVRGVGRLQTLEDIGAVVVSTKNGTPVTVSDLGTLRLANQERHGILGKDYNNDSIEGITLLSKGANASEVMKGLHARVDELNAKLKAQDVRIVPYIDRSNLIDATISKVSHTVFEGIGLVIIVLILFLGSARAAMIVAVVVPFAMLVTFGLMHLTGVSANLLSLGAIDFGILVDGAVVMTEAILRRREAHPETELSEDEVRASAVSVARPIFFATLIIVAAYLPLFAFQRVEAKLFSPMAYAVGFSLLGALVLSLTLVPALAYRAFRKPRKVFHNPVLERVDIGYRRWLARLLDRPRIAVVTAAMAAVAVVGLGASVGREYLPELDEGSLWLQVSMPAGISLETAKKMAGDLRAEVLKFPEVSNMVTQTGRNDDGTDPFTPSHIEASVGLKPYNTWPDGESKDELIRRMNERLSKLPGYEIGFSQPMIDGVNDKIAGAHSQLVVKVFGDDLKEGRRIAKDIVGVLKTVRGSYGVAIDQEPPLPQIVVKIDRAAIARYGINVADVSDLLTTAVGGQGISQISVGERAYDLAVRFPPEARDNVDRLGDLVLTASNGAHVPLSSVARIDFKTGESTITRELGRRHLTVKLDYRDRDLTSFLTEAQQKIDTQVKYDHSKFELSFGGQFENQRRAEARLRIIFAIVVALMLVLLFSLFGKFRHALLVLGLVPLATLGGLVALHLTGRTLNVASAVGFIALFGVAVQNGILMVSNLNAARDRGLALVQAVIEGASERLRAVLTTATVATVGMLPAALATGVGSDVQRGIGTVVVGGLILTTVLTLFLVPAIYFLIERQVERRAARRVVCIQEPALS